MICEITIKVRVDAPSVGYILQTYMKEEYPSLPDVVSIEIREIKEREDARQV